ncbi:helix-turn-helix domain-containing protein [Cellulomonas septica]
MPSTTDQTSAPQRMTGAERREQILVAARRVFAEGGYAASTDEVARAAGVSQPYVVRLFGSKRELFLEAYRQASAEVLAALAGVPAGPEAGKMMGDAYVGLLDDRDLLRLLMHGFIAGADDEVGRVARHTLGEAFRLFRERSGATEDEARVFVAQGMLINVLLAVDAHRHQGEDDGMDGLVLCTLDGIARLS